MVYRTEGQIGRALSDQRNGKRLAKEALDRGEYALAWKHAEAYRLDVLDIASLGLPEQYRPKGFNPEMPKAMGSVR